MKSLRKTKRTDNDSAFEGTRVTENNTNRERYTILVEHHKRFLPFAK